ncbi:type II toxin-antitoxin system HicB family antitoxin [Aetokthonos hydrillicola Thurmond2011]|jgi:predicted RNase H-like HicB family nuclease|uniref:Type II toxin-antitoxin system HicB family antitoxin n=1 Tax=Aetokthonos hydrillicola Thurmond2011 TaxID=2712845 RepID=A0AAP5IDF3_9CYAN|nr:type II toxin-antitoxin system HicB family antitoxin [Aetokthonos hydrillicola]MBO3459520.1 type II toxin-antitoxin system HicB family antitoxin [Aetokthonos hydrillicola CCALA 1050]MBW4591055.1 type II toxin-antitoxin system HicB family antitoxin [Aetokthonos hydrillicola CCALA 1050]MDR9899446.1 type II toxin-antitoxin system HicB family antitoxin [Aetokthonos hydrillicola Thurmond2011]
MISVSPSNLTYNVLIEHEPDGRFSALALGLSDCKSLGNTEKEALENLQEVLQKRLQNSKIVTLEINSPQANNPWTKIAGMYKDNPLFDEVLADIETERCKLDAEIDEYYRQMDSQDGVK